MIGTSSLEYIFIRTSIFCLQYTTPLCLSYLSIRMISASGSAGAGVGAVLQSWTGRAALGCSVLDTLHGLFIYYPYTRRRLTKPAEHPPPLPPAERRALFTRCLDNVPDAKAYLRNWFLGADACDIRQDNVWEFLSWAFFDRNPGNETEAEREELGDYVTEVERRIGHQLEPGRGNAKSLRLTLDEIEVRYRSVVWCSIVGIVDLLTHITLSIQGFQFHAQSGTHLSAVIPLRAQSLFTKKQSVSQLSYWYRPHTAKDKMPLVFLHGIGIGLWPYMQYLTHINRDAAEDDQVGIIAVEYLPVSARLTTPPLSKDEFLSQITCILDAHGWDKFTVVGHSYGTALTTHMLKSPALNPRVQSIILVDPVSILLHLPDVAYNFTRRKPRKANEYLLWYFASMDPGVAHCLARHFFWKDNIAWKEDLLQITRSHLAASGEINDDNRQTEPRSRSVVVCLAEQDLIVDTPTVLKYLLGDDDWVSQNGAMKKIDPFRNEQQQPVPEPVGGHFEHNGIEVVWFEGLDHAQAFDRKDISVHLAALTRRSCVRG